MCPLLDQFLWGIQHVTETCLVNSKVNKHVINQGLFLVDFIAVIGFYSQCQKVLFFPNFWRKIPNFKSEKKIEEKSSFLSWLKLT